MRRFTFAVGTEELFISRAFGICTLAGKRELHKPQQGKDRADRCDQACHQANVDIYLQQKQHSNDLREYAKQYRGIF